MTASARRTFKTSVFLSYPKPCMQQQQTFITTLCDHLDDRGFSPRTLGVTDYDLDAPLKAVRRLMLESNGIITVAFRRTYIEQGVTNYRTDLSHRRPAEVNGAWLTSPWAQIEPAMAYQLGLPVLILREEGVLAEGVLDRGVVGTYSPVFTVDDPAVDYFRQPEWQQLIATWEAQVRRVVDRKGNPPELY